MSNEIQARLESRIVARRREVEDSTTPLRHLAAERSAESVFTASTVNGASPRHVLIKHFRVYTTDLAVDSQFVGVPPDTTVAEVGATHSLVDLNSCRSSSHIGTK